MTSSRPPREALRCLSSPDSGHVSAHRGQRRRAPPMDPARTLWMLGPICAVAEGFEPSRGLPPYTLSRRAPSSARAGHRHEFSGGVFRQRDRHKRACFRRASSFSRLLWPRSGTCRLGTRLSVASGERQGWTSLWAATTVRASWKQTRGGQHHVRGLSVCGNHERAGKRGG